MGEEWLYWVGCAGSVDPRNQQVAVALVELLGLADIGVRILGTEERCCGDPARRLGNEYLFQSLMEHNRAAIERTGLRQIVTACPHCYRVLLHDYGFGETGYRVVHHATLLAGLIDEGRLPPAAAQLKGRTAYHDSCYLGRYEGIYDAPRTTLRAVCDEVVELPRALSSTFCCGGGGGRTFLEEPEGERINHMRTDEVIAAEVETLATACPFCMTMLSDGAKDRGGAHSVLDIAEVVRRTIVSGACGDGSDPGVDPAAPACGSVEARG